MTRPFVLRGGSTGIGKMSTLLDELMRHVLEARERAAAAALRHCAAGDLEWIERDGPVENLGDRTQAIELVVLDAARTPVTIWRVELRWSGLNCAVHETWIRPE